MKPRSCSGGTRFHETRSASRETSFAKDLKGLMSTYGKDLEDIIEIFDSGSVVRGDKLLVGNEDAGSKKNYRQSRLKGRANKIGSDNGLPFVRNSKYRSGKGFLVHKNKLFDLCPELMMLDDAQGERLFRDFIRHFNYSGLVFDWTQHLILYRWLKNSPYSGALEEKHLEAVMTAAVSLWCENDKSSFQGLALTHRDSTTTMIGWKYSHEQDDSVSKVVPNEIDTSVLKDFAFCVLPQGACGSLLGYESLN